MTQPKNAAYTEAGRGYIWPPTGEEFISITTVIKNGIPKPSIIYWGCKRVAETAMDNLDVLNKLNARASNKKAINKDNVNPEMIQ